MLRRPSAKVRQHLISERLTKTNFIISLLNIFLLIAIVTLSYLLFTKIAIASLGTLEANYIILDDMILPAPPIEFSAAVYRELIAHDMHGDNQGSDVLNIKKSLTQQAPQFAECFEKAARLNPYLNIQVDIEFELDDIGRVSAIKAQSDNSDHPVALSCLLTSISLIDFPRLNHSPVIVFFPFSYNGTTQ
jgi:hypothetical protein